MTLRVRCLSYTEPYPMTTCSRSLFKCKVCYFISGLGLRDSGSHVALPGRVTFQVTCRALLHDQLIVSPGREGVYAERQKPWEVTMNGSSFILIRKCVGYDLRANVISRDSR